MRKIRLFTIFFTIFLSQNNLLNAGFEKKYFQSGKSIDVSLEILLRLAQTAGVSTVNPLPEFLNFLARILDPGIYQFGSGEMKINNNQYMVIEESIPSSTNLQLDLNNDSNQSLQENNTISDSQIAANILPQVAQLPNFWPENALSNIGLQENQYYFPLGFLSLESFIHYINLLLSPLHASAQLPIYSIHHLVFHGSSVSGHSYTQRHRFDEGQDPSDFDIAIVSAELFERAVNSASIDIKSSPDSPMGHHTQPLSQNHMDLLGLADLYQIALEIAPVDRNGQPRETNFMIYSDLDSARYRHTGACIVVDIIWFDGRAHLIQSYISGGDINNRRHSKPKKKNKP